jgi:hypothetical protein
VHHDRIEAQRLQLVEQRRLLLDGDDLRSVDEALRLFERCAHDILDPTPTVVLRG